MKKSIKRILLILSASTLLGLGILTLMMLSPALLYAHSSQAGPIIMLLQQELDSAWVSLVKSAVKALEGGELFPEGNWRSDLCLNDGSPYPTLITSILGDDVIRAFAHKIVVVSSHKGVASLHKWDTDLSTSQWVRHALVHNFQYQHHGFWGANPLGRYPEWKWEGYAEYASIGQQLPLDTLWQRYQTHTEGPYTLVSLGNNLYTIHQHVRFLLLSKYCLEIRKMDYDSFMQSNKPADDWWAELESFIVEARNQGCE
ncbi:MAG: hypothetical protein AAFV07_02260 [Bacteroidota bacterium]